MKMKAAVSNIGKAARPTMAMTATTKRLYKRLSKRLRLFFLVALIFAFNITSAQQKQEVQVLPNYTLKYSVTTSAKKETIWRLWEDVENWKDYDTVLKYSYLENDADFAEGAVGYVKGEGAPRTKFKLIKVDPGVSFTERLYVPLYQAIDLQRYFEESPEGTTTFTHEVNFKGRLSFLIYAIAGKAFKRDLHLVMNRMKALAELEESEVIEKNRKEK